MINPEHKLSVSKQAELLEISRSTVYYRSRPVSEADLFLMRRIDELHLNYPFAGSRMLRDLLFREGLQVGRRHVRTLMRRMGIETLYRKPNLSKPAPEHKIYPTCCAASRSRGPIKSGPRTSPTFPWHAAFSIWPQWWTGSAAACSRGG